ncbi:DMT family transporter [Candidatus Sumerlaeota bacterium]|nr:DMT family transporter [Candidatus Sumerlaeota bacterium]
MPTPESHARPSAHHFAAITAAVVMFANAFPAVKVCLGALEGEQIAHPALAFVPLRFVPVALIFLLVSLIALRRETWALLTRHPLRIALAGLCVVPGYNLCVNAGLEEINPGVSSLIVATAPIQTMLLSLAILGERIQVRRLLGITIAFGGMLIVVTLGQGHHVTAAMLRGALVTLLAPAMWAMFTILLKPVIGSHRPLVATAVAVMIGTVPVLLLFERGSIGALLEAPRGLGSWLFLSIGATALGFWLWTIPLRVISPTALAIFVYFIPLVAIVSSIWLWHTETFNLWLALGGVVVIAGVAQANIGLWRRPAPG